MWWREGPGSVFYVDNILRPNITKFYKIWCKQQKIFDASKISENRTLGAYGPLVLEYGDCFFFFFFLLSFLFCFFVCLFLPFLYFFVVFFVFFCFCFDCLFCLFVFFFVVFFVFLSFLSFCLFCLFVFFVFLSFLSFCLFFSFCIFCLFFLLYFCLFVFFVFLPFCHHYHNHVVNIYYHNFFCSNLTIFKFWSRKGEEDTSVLVHWWTDPPPLVGTPAQIWVLFFKWAFPKK